MELVIIAVCSLLILFFDFRVILKDKNSKEIYFYAAALLVSLPVLMLRSLGINLPDPGIFILEAVKSFFTL